MQNGMSFVDCLQWFPIPGLIQPSTKERRLKFTTNQLQLIRTNQHNWPEINQPGLILPWTREKVTGLNQLQINCGWFNQYHVPSPNWIKQAGWSDCQISGDQPLAVADSTIQRYPARFESMAKINNVSGWFNQQPTALTFPTVLETMQAPYPLQPRTTLQLLIHFLYSKSRL